MRFDIFAVDVENGGRKFYDVRPDADCVRYAVDIPDAYDPSRGDDGHISLTREGDEYALNDVVTANDINQPIISWADIANIDDVPCPCVSLEVLAIDGREFEREPLSWPEGVDDLISRFASMGLRFSIHPETGRLVIRPEDGTARFVRKTFPGELETIRYGLKNRWNQRRYAELARQQAKRKAAEKAAEKDGE